MTWFMWTMVVLLALDAACKLGLLAFDRDMSRSRAALAIDVALNMALGTWALVLLL